MNIRPPLWLVNWLVSTAKRLDQKRLARDGHILGNLYGSDGSLYMERHVLIPYNWTQVAARIHIIRRSDMDLDTHDHPWLFNISWLLGGHAYREEVPDVINESMLSPDDSLTIWRVNKTILRRNGDIIFRGQNARHRITLNGPGWDEGKPYVISLFITGPWRHKWGFYWKDKKIYWKDYIALRDKFPDQETGQSDFDNAIMNGAVPFMPKEEW